MGILDVCTLTTLISWVFSLFPCIILYSPSPVPPLDFFALRMVTHLRHLHLTFFLPYIYHPSFLSYFLLACNFLLFSLLAYVHFVFWALGR